MKSITDQLTQLLTDYLSFHMSMEEYKKRVREIVKERDAFVVGEDKEKNQNYSILNAFRRMEEDVREHINSLKREIRQRQEETV